MASKGVDHSKGQHQGLIFLTKFTLTFIPMVYDERIGLTKCKIMVFY